VDLDPQLREIIRCPECRGTFGEPTAGSITCAACGLSYPIRNGVPVLLLDEATRPTAG